MDKKSKRCLYIWATASMTVSALTAAGFYHLIKVLKD